MLIDLIAVDQLSFATRVMGPAVVDGMIKEAGRNLRAFIGPNHTVYHVGVAQLACLAPDDLDNDGYRDLLTRNAGDLRAICGESSLGTVSIGVAPFVLDAMAPADVLRIAQGAALDARASGTLFAFHCSDQDLAFQRSYRLLRDFEGAIRDRRELGLMYQPRVDAASGRCLGVEALLRWTHPMLGAISPSEFVPLVEHSPLAQPMTAWVLETAMNQLARWLGDGLELRMSVNISAANLRDVDFAEAVQRILTSAGITPSAVELEVTETAVMGDAERAHTQLTQLASSGVCLAIDDFGTGYSSLSHLQRLPLHVVKIDRSFMANLDSDPRQLSLVTMMIEMSKHLGYRVVAEGVETQEVVECLRRTACDEIQGYFYAKPMSAQAFATWFLARSDEDSGACGA